MPLVRALPLSHHTRRRGGAEVRPANVLTSFGEGLCQLASFGCKGGDQIAVGLDVEAYTA